MIIILFYNMLNKYFNNIYGENNNQQFIKYNYKILNSNLSMWTIFFTLDNYIHIY